MKKRQHQQRNEWNYYILFVPLRSSWKRWISVLWLCFIVKNYYHQYHYRYVVIPHEELPVYEVLPASDRTVRNAHEDWPPSSMLDALLQQQEPTSDNPMHATTKNRRLVVTAANSEYVDFADNFAQSLLSLDVHNFVLVPMDMDAYYKLSFAYPKHTLPLMPGTSHSTDAAAYSSPEFKQLTSTRPKFLQSFLSKGYTVLYNDIDMVWRQNLWDVIDERSVVIDANGTRTEADSIMWMDGQQICTCNLYLVPTRHTKFLLQKWATAIDSNKFEHDQDAFSKVIEHLGFPYSMEMEAAEIEKLNFPLRASNYSFLIYNNDDQLPSAVNYTWDDPSQDDNVTVLIHNNWIIGKQNKTERFHKAGLWHLSENIPTTKELISFGISVYEEAIKVTEGRSKYCATKEHRASTERSLFIASDCLRMTNSTMQLDYPLDADKHFNEIRLGLSEWAQHIYHSPHVGDQYGGPWIENHFIDYFESLYNKVDDECLSSIFGPFIPIFLPWTDIWVNNGFKYPDLLLVALRKVLRPNVPYITVCQSDNGLTGRNELLMSSIPNVAVLSSGGYGHIPIPLLKKEEKMINDVVPVSKRTWDVSYVGSLQSAPKKLRSEMNKIMIRHNSSSFRYAYINGTNWRRIVKKSKFSLIPRSYGRSDYRLMKVLQMGYIPIYVYLNNDTAWVPYADLFHKIGFATDIHGLNSLVLQLKSLSDEEIEKRERHIRSLRERFFTYKGVLHQIESFVKGENNELRCQPLPSTVRGDE